MSIRIFALDPTQPVPLDMAVELRCDGASLFCVSQTFVENWYPTAATRAVRGGWTLTAGRHLGPCCSGKAAS